MKEYISKIIDDDIRKNVENAYNKLPEYFHKIPASSTGKHHPSFAIGEGGLVRHTKFACDIALELFNITQFEPLQKDAILASLILHDGLKQGHEQNGNTIKEHDDIMANWLNEIWPDFIYRNEIIECIRRHMGQWATTIQPVGKLQVFVHWCDYLASRKFYDNYYKG